MAERAGLNANASRVNYNQVLTKFSAARPNRTGGNLPNGDQE